MRIVFLWFQVKTVFTISRNMWKHCCSWVRGAVVQKGGTVSVQCWQGLLCRRVARCLSSGDRGLLCRRVARCLSNVAHAYALYCVLKFTKQLLYALDVRGIKVRFLARARNFQSVYTASGAHPAPCLTKTADFPRVESVGWADHSSSSSSAEVKNAGNCKSTPHIYISQCEIWSLWGKNIDWNFLMTKWWGKYLT